MCILKAWGSNSAIFVFCLSSYWGQHLGEGICSLSSRFLPLRVDPLLEDFFPSGNQTRRQKLLPFGKVGEKWRCTTHLKVTETFKLMRKLNIFPAFLSGDRTSYISSDSTFITGNAKRPAYNTLQYIRISMS